MTPNLSDIVCTWPSDVPFCARTAASMCSSSISNDQLFDLAIEECLDSIDRNNPIEIGPFLRRFPEIADRLLPALGVIPQVTDHDWPRVGDIIDDHKIIQYLGFGESSRVYLTDDGRSGGRATVLKITATPTNESVYLARLNHPSLPTLYQGAKDSRHLLLQYVVGPNAMVYLSSHAATSGGKSHGSAERGEYYHRTVAAIECIASAIDHIHARGVAHNDIKPSNIIIGESQTVLIDFDAASEIGIHGSRRPIGTIDYLSNESLEELARNGQLVGQNCINDDHFAFAVTCFEMLAGTLPWTRHRDEVTPVLCKRLLEERQRLSVDSAMAKVVPQALLQDFVYIFNSTASPPSPIHLARTIASHYGIASHRGHRITTGVSFVSALLLALMIALSLPIGLRTEFQPTIEASSDNSSVVTDPNHPIPSMLQSVRTPMPLIDANDTDREYQRMSATDTSKLSSKDAARFAYAMFLIKPNHEWQVRLYESTIANGDANAAVWNNYGFSLVCSRRPAEARKAFQTAIQHDPNLPQPYLHLASLDEVCPGKYGAAPIGVNAFAALQRVPSDPIVRRLAASALKSLGAANDGKHESQEAASRLLKSLMETRHQPPSQPLSPCVDPFPASLKQAAKSEHANHKP
jgi:eukaryotic-like serine/threonine-protein kinase